MDGSMMHGRRRRMPRSVALRAVRRVRNRTVTADLLEAQVADVASARQRVLGRGYGSGLRPRIPDRHHPPRQRATGSYPGTRTTTDRATLLRSQPPQLPRPVPEGPGVDAELGRDRSWCMIGRRPAGPARRGVVRPAEVRQRPPGLRIQTQPSHGTAFPSLCDPPTYCTLSQRANAPNRTTGGIASSLATGDRAAPTINLGRWPSNRSTRYLARCHDDVSGFGE
jgi:hypothetical protein